MKYALIALVAGLAACDGGKSDSGDTSTTTTPTGTTGPNALEISSYVAQCATDSSYTGDLDTTDATDGAAVIDMWETNSSNGWNEEHYLVSDVPTDDHLALTLTTNVAIGDVTTDESDGVGKSLFSCAADGQLQDTTTMTYAIRIYDPSGTLAQCCAFGFTPEIVAAGSYVTSGGAPSSPSELDSCSTTCAGL